MTEEANSAAVTARKVAVITGASSGIGRATALEFARQNYNVVLTARRASELKEVAKECEELGVLALAVIADTTDEGGLQNVAAASLQTYGHFDVWVNDAGVSVFGKFLDTPMEDFQRVIETNLMGYVYGTRVAMTQFRTQGHGTLINVSSINAKAPVPYASAYVASKFAVRGFTESLRMELELEGLSSNIHVCNVMPSSIDTNFFQNAANYSGREPLALEPVYDPAYVARHIVTLAREPQRELIVGPAGKVMALEHMAMPDMYEKFMAKFIDSNNLGKEPAAATKGNLYSPIAGNTGIRGGWRERRLRADTLNMMAGTAAAAVVGIIGAGYVLTKRHQAHAKG